MKNNIAFKFIAIILCAASLLGAIGGIAGVVVLTEADLYNKTAEQVKQDRIAQNSEVYSGILAQMYASSALGSCPESMVTDVKGNAFWFENVYPNYGYRILDSEGNVLSSYNETLKDTVTTFTYPASGQYMHLVSTESESEIQAREAEKALAAYAAEPAALTDSDSNTIPASGILIDSVQFLDAYGTIFYEAKVESEGHVSSTMWHPITDGGSNYIHSVNHVGFLFYNNQGELVYHSFLEGEYADFPPTEVYAYNFMNWTTGFSFHNSGDNIGTLTNEDGIFRFVSTAVLPTAADETVPETEAYTEPTIAPETVPPTTEALTETAPETSPLVDENGNPIETADQEETASTEATAAATEATAETTAEAETVPSSASAVPEETAADAATEATAVTEAVEATEAAEATEMVTEPTIAETLPPETVPAETVPVETLPEVTEPVLINGKSLDNYQINTHEYWDPDAQERMTAKYVYVPMPEMTVEMYVDEEAMRDASGYELMALVRQYRSYMLPAIGICLLSFAIFAVYLCTAAGRKPKTDEVKAGGLNRIPLDLYLVAGGFAIAVCISFGVKAFMYLIDQNLLVGCATGVGLFFLASLIFVGFCFAFVAQIKTPGGFWWHNSLCGICIRGCARFAVWLEQFLALKVFPFLGRLIKKAWQFTCKVVVWMYHVIESAILWLGNKLGKLFRWMGGKLHRFFSLLPLTWQWLVGGFFMMITLLLCYSASDFSSAPLLFGILISIALILYGAHCFGILSESTKRMGKGDLDTKVDDKLMIGCFKDFAADLNDLADVAVVAAQKQLKSERMKTELITNVSHDIKTPLTSIINYVDLLQKPHTDAEEVQYLEVLDRQSQRLKKLIDDLMDMSKANTGNMQVDITKLDAVESVNQALGEFADKLDKAQLLPVFRHDEDRVPMMADGRLVWRVMSNLLSNAVKYAMPGTRLYIDLMTLEGKVVISLKNISREELNVDADELMERFVRGDDSRNTEGSGLGLNIAKSLMELQKGQLQLLVDGDLFKVTLIFPGA